MYVVAMNIFRVWEIQPTDVNCFSGRIQDGKKFGPKDWATLFDLSLLHSAYKGTNQSVSGIRRKKSSCTTSCCLDFLWIFPPLLTEIGTNWFATVVSGKKKHPGLDE